MIKLVFKKQSQDDLTSIFDRIADYSPEVAQQFVEQIIANCETLQSYPKLGSRCDEISAGLRRTLYRTYGIYYRYHEQAGEVVIVRVLHHSRDLQTRLFE